MTKLHRNVWFDQPISILGSDDRLLVPVQNAETPGQCTVRIGPEITPVHQVLYIVIPKKEDLEKLPFPADKDPSVSAITIENISLIGLDPGIMNFQIVEIRAKTEKSWEKGKTYKTRFAMWTTKPEAPLYPSLGVWLPPLCPGQMIRIDVKATPRDVIARNRVQRERMVLEVPVALYGAFCLHRLPNHMTSSPVIASGMPALGSLTPMPGPAENRVNNPTPQGMEDPENSEDPTIVTMEPRTNAIPTPSPARYAKGTRSKPLPPPPQPKAQAKLSGFSDLWSKK